MRCRRAPLELTENARFALIAGFAIRARLGLDRAARGSRGPRVRLVKAGNQSSIMKRTYQPSKTRRARTHGFLVRMKSRGGRAVINARRAKGRKRLAV